MKLKLNHIIFMCTMILLTNSSFSQTPEWNWAENITGNFDQKSYCITADSKANIYVAGEFVSDSLTIGTQTIFNANGSYSIFLAKIDTGGTVIWLKSFGGNKNDVPSSIVVDKHDNLYMVGKFESTSLAFDNNKLNNAGNTDGFIVKFNASGTSIWAKGVASASEEEVRAIEIDTKGNVVIAGNFSGPTVKIGDSTLINSYPSKDEIMIAKFNSNGTLKWANTISGKGDDVATDLAINNSDDIVLIGNFIDEDLKADNLTLSNKGEADICMIKFSSSGPVLWANSIGASKYEEVKSISLTPNGDLIICGSFSSPSLNVGSTTLSSHASNSKGDILYFELKKDGDFGWAKSSGGSEGEGAWSVLTDSQNNSYIMGNFSSSSLSFDALSVTNIDPGFHDVFIVKLDNMGKSIWVKKVEDTKKEKLHTLAWAMVMDKFGGIYTTGYFGPSQLSFDSNMITNPALSNSSFIAKIENQDINIGVNEDRLKDNFVKIYPNPFHNNLMLSSSEVLVEIDLYNSLGSVVYSTKNIDGLVKNISTKKWPNGVYYLIAKTMDGSLIKSKIIKE